MQFNDDERTIRTLRHALASPAILGSKAHEISDEQVLEVAGRLADQFIEMAPAIVAIGKEIAAGLGRVAEAAREFAAAFDAEATS